MGTTYQVLTLVQSQNTDTLKKLLAKADLITYAHADKFDNATLPCFGANTLTDYFQNYSANENLSNLGTRHFDIFPISMLMKNPTWYVHVLITEQRFFWCDEWYHKYEKILTGVKWELNYARWHSWMKKYLVKLSDEGRDDSLFGVFYWARD